MTGKPRGTTQVVTRGYLMVNCRFRWRLQATVHPRLSVRGCQGGYELMISWYKERISEPIIGNKCGGWSDDMTKMPPDLAL
ncbi:hypothetical protein Tco_1290969 [Tanacetum coccineum]